MGRPRAGLPLGATIGLVGGAALLLVTLPLARPVAAAPDDAWSVWLDAPLPHDLAPGSPVHLGFIVWNAADSSTVTVFGSEVRLHPAGAGRVRKATPDTDWPGHSFVDFVVPPGGLGGIEFGIYRNAGVSGAGTTISLDFHRIPIAGVGPPPGISLRTIGTVRPAPTGPVIVGQPVDVDLRFAPRVAWPSGAVKPPDALTLRVREPGGAGAQEFPATLVDASAVRYRATLDLDRPGPYILEAAMEPDAPSADRFTESEVRVVAEMAPEPGESVPPTAPGAPAAGITGGNGPGAAGGSPVGPVAATGPSLPLGVLVLGGVALAVVLGWLIRFLRAEW